MASGLLIARCAHRVSTVSSKWWKSVAGLLTPDDIDKANKENRNPHVSASTTCAGVALCGVVLAPMRFFVGKTTQANPP